MSGIAEVLLNLGYPVTGLGPARERHHAPPGGARRAASASATAPRTSARADVVVVSSAVRPDNPEIAAARARSIPVIPRAEMLGELMRVKDGVAVAGSHGKTTTTTMIAAILAEAGARSDRRHRRQGARLRLERAPRPAARSWSPRPTSPTARSATCSRPSRWSPTSTASTWTTSAPSEALCAAFLDFAEKVPFYGLVVIGADNPAAARLAPLVSKRHVTYGLAAGDWRGEILDAGPGGTRFRVRVRGERARRGARPHAGRPLRAATRWRRCAWPTSWACRSRPRARRWPAFEGVDRRFTRPRRGRRGAGGRRLRPPPDRAGGDGRGGASLRPAAGGRLPAPPLHAHARPAARVRARARRRRRAAADRRLRGGRGADRRASTRRRCWRPSPTGRRATCRATG